MTTNKSGYSVNLVYSYSHRDTQHRESMEKSLTMLKREGLLVDWSDQSILAGQNLSAVIRGKLDNADIIVFLLSPDFIASEECMKEWERAQQLTIERPQLVRVPVIVRDCAWKDLLKEDNLKALPKDAAPVVGFTDRDAAWQQVYEGLKEVIKNLRCTFEARETFLAEMRRTDFVSQQNIDLQDIFVFLPLLVRTSHERKADRPAERITDAEELLDKKYAIIHGDDRSGKTALGRHVFLTLVGQSKPVLHLDLNEVSSKRPGRIFEEAYHSQFTGDFKIWSQQSEKTLILDNLSGRSALADFIVAAKEEFERIIVTLPSTVFYAFYRDEARLADFEEMEIGNLTQVTQETLIRKRLALSSGKENIADGDVDKAEKRVNAIIIDNRIVPRYPFFVLCILQTYEAYMPTNLNITSYGHCYYALIVASLDRAGISNEDADINPCFNFAEHLAYEKHLHLTRSSQEDFDFKIFTTEYRKKYFIADATINRLMHEDFGLMNQDGQFRSEYMAYFFLGRRLASDTPANKDIVKMMCDDIYVPSNYLTLLFTIHHARELEIVDEILLRTMVSLDDIAPAQLTRSETGRFADIVSQLPSNVLSSASVEAERQQERSRRDEVAEMAEDASDDDKDNAGDNDAINDVYRVLKNNEIMGQILRNKYGSIERIRIEEIIGVMAEGGLRLVNSILRDEGEISGMASYVKAKNPTYDIEDIKRDLGMFSFFWTMMNVEKIVEAVNVPEIRAAIRSVAASMDNPAYDLISYFVLLDSEPKLTDEIRDQLAALLKKHRDPFVKGVLSLRTQWFMNTHRSSAQLEQSVCALLGIRYVPRAHGRIT